MLIASIAVVGKHAPVPSEAIEGTIVATRCAVCGRLILQLRPEGTRGRRRRICGHAACRAERVGEWKARWRLNDRDRARGPMLPGLFD